MSKTYLFAALLLLSTILLFTNCASYKTFYNDLNLELAVDDTLNIFPPSTNQIKHQILLLGDLGAGRDLSHQTAILDEISNYKEDDLILLLGDQISELGYPKPTDKNADAVQQELENRIGIFKDFKGQLIVIPGDRDWGKEGAGSLAREEEAMRKVLGDDFIYAPENGCGDPEAIEVSDKLVVIPLNSAWWLSNWNQYETINEDCEIRNRTRYYLALQDEIKKYVATHHVIIATHHPIASTGERAGYYSAKQHLLPLPLIGSARLFIKTKLSDRQDMTHYNYLRYIDEMDDLKQKFPGLLFASAHEQGLLYSRKKDQHYMVSGSLTAAKPLRDKSNFMFGHPGIGWLKLIIKKDGAVDLQAFGKTKDQQNFRQFYVNTIKPAIPTVEQVLPDGYEYYGNGMDSITTTVLNDGELWDFSNRWWGALNTKYFFEEVRVPLLNLDTIDGGLEVIRKGGGFQTQSAHLINKNDRLYKMRSLRKRADKLLPYPFNKTFATEIAKKQLTAGNPFGALVLDPMAKAVNIYYTNPRLYFLPKQPALGRFVDLGGELYLLEERPDEDWRTLDHFGNSKEIVSNSKMVKERLQGGQVLIDQEWTMRTRLFDILVGDWDRHVDQWRWASKKIPGEPRILYRPIPRDRDQVFSKYDGIIPGILRKTFPFFRATQTFDFKIKDRDVIWMNRQARNFDRLFLNGLDWKDWEREVENIQTQLADKYIEQGLAEIPEAVKGLVAEEQWAEKLKQRRADLKIYARKYYEFYSKIIQIPASYLDNRIEIIHFADSTQVTITEKTERGWEMLYQRKFTSALTKELRIYGLDGDDEFLIKGNSNKGILLRLVGGIGDDTYIDESKISGLKKHTKIYDTPEGNTIERSSETNIRLTNRYRINRYEFHSNEMNYGFAIPDFGFNPDDGLFLGARYLHRDFRFGRVNNYYGHAKVALATGAMQLGLHAEYEHLFGKYDATFNADWDGPQYVINYYGQGNETELVQEENRDFARVRRENLFLSPGIQYRWNIIRSRVQANVFYQQTRIERTPNRILNSEFIKLPDSDFEWQRYAGLRMRIRHNNVDDVLIPERGMRFDLQTSWQANLKDLNENFFTVKSEVSFYNTIDKKNKFVIANRIGTQLNTGSYFFFQAAMLGGKANLRGYRSERFNGDISFYHNIDFRFRLISTKFFRVPYSLGITPSFDYGRVWLRSESSDIWHYGYGAQIWMAPLDYFIIGFGFHKSPEDQRFSVKIGHFF